MLAKLSYYIRTATPQSDALREFDRVRLLHSVEDDGVTIPAGATGAIVMVHDFGKAFTVEVVEPVHAVFTVEAGSIEPTSEAPREHLPTMAFRV